MLSSLVVAVSLALGQTPSTEPSAETPPSTPEPGFLMKALQDTGPGQFLDAHKIQISGWTDLSFTASSANRSQSPLGFNDRANDFLLQQNWLRIDKAVDTSGTSPSFGFRSDTILPGSDYRYTLARGLFDGQLTANHGQPNLYGIDPIQFYAEAYFPNVAKGLDLKVGHFFAQYGVEANDAVSNALASHAYTYIYNPFTHTGAVATLKLDDTWSVQSGLVLGSDVFIDPASELTYLGSVKWAPAEGKSTALFSVILGSNRFNQRENFHNPDIFDLVFTHKVNDKLNYTFESLYGFTNNVPNIGFANWLGVLNYLTYEFTPKVSGTTRLEFFDDCQGQRTGFAGLYTTLTAGLSIKPHDCLLFRPEIRYDYNSDSRPFENRHGVFTATADLILKW